MSRSPAVDVPTTELYVHPSFCFSLAFPCQLEYVVHSNRNMHRQSPSARKVRIDLVDPLRLLPTSASPKLAVVR